MEKLRLLRDHNLYERGSPVICDPCRATSQPGAKTEWVKETARDLSGLMAFSVEKFNRRSGRKKEAMLGKEWSYG